MVTAKYTLEWTVVKQTLPQRPVATSASLRTSLAAVH